MSPYLSDYALDTWQRQTLVVGFNNPLQQVVTQHLEYHTHIWDAESRIRIIIHSYKTHVKHTDQDTYAIDSRDLEVIYQLNHHVLVGVDGVTLSHLKEKSTMR